jgi:hypothetical protein
LSGVDGAGGEGKRFIFFGHVSFWEVDLGVPPSPYRCIAISELEENRKIIQELQ